MEAAHRNKEEGNSCFQASRFEDAQERYSAGLRVLLERATESRDADATTTDRVIDGNFDSCVALQAAVLCSNRGNCWFELGDYRNAARDSHRALEWIASARRSAESHATAASTTTKMLQDDDDHQTQNSFRGRLDALRDKNQWRLARALFYARDGPALKALVASLDANDNDSHAIENEVDIRAKIDPFLRSLEFFDTRFPKKPNRVAGDEKAEKDAVSFLPRLVRSSLSNPDCEYYNFGHDIAESALENVELFDKGGVVSSHRTEGSTETDADGSKKTIESSINVLYGGIGDGRHALATILDVHSRNTDDETTGPVKLHMAMNDINAQTLVKDILVLVVSEKIAKLTPDGMPSFDDDDPRNRRRGNEEAIGLVCVLYYSYLSYAMPRAVYERLQAVVREIFWVPHDSFSKTYPWLCVDECDWPAFQRIASHWVDTSRYPTPLWSVKEILANYVQKDPWTKPRDFDTNREELAAQGLSNIAIDRIVQQKAEHKRTYEEEKRKFLESNRDVSAWPPEFMEQVLERSPDGASEKTIQTIGFEIMGEMADNVDESGCNSVKAPMVMMTDKFFSQFTKTILPPSFPRNVPGLEKDMDLSRELSDLVANEEPHRGVLRKFQDHVHSDWKVNPVKFDPDYFTPPERDTMCAVLDFTEAFLRKNNRKNFSVDAPENWDDVICSKTLFEIVALFFVNTGHAIVNLVSGNNLSIEISYGSIIDFGVKAQLHEASMGPSGTRVPRNFSRMILSNVPDYVGLLSTFVSLGPLMENTPMITFMLSCNVLLNTSIFKSYDEYVCGTCASTAKQVERLLGFQVLDDEPSVFLPFNRWGICGKGSSKTKPVSAMELKTWLYRLYMCSVLPPPREQHHVISVEQRPNTVGLFLLTCKYCLSIGYPIHWITTVLDRLLTTTAKKPLTTRAKIADESPSCTIGLERGNNRYNLSAFRLELGNQLSIFIQNGLLPDSIVSIRGLPLGKRQRYSLKVDRMNLSVEAGRNADQLKFTIGFLLEKLDSVYGNNDHDISDFASFLRMMERSRETDTKFRKDLLENGDRVGHLFSCAEYNKNTSRLLFDMCEDTFQKFGDYFISIVLTDSWKVVKQTPRLRLSDSVLSIVE